MKKNRIISALILLIALCCFTACKTDDTQVSEQKVEAGTTTPSETQRNEHTTNYEITDWSTEDFSTIQCKGIDISLPFKLSDVEKNFKVKLVKADKENPTSRDWYEIYCKNKCVGSFCYYNDDYNTETDTVSFIELNSFEINGLTEKSTKEEVQKVLGAGNNIDNEMTDCYVLQDDTFIVVFTYIEEDRTTVSICIK